MARAPDPQRCKPQYTTFCEPFSNTAYGFVARLRPCMNCPNCMVQLLQHSDVTRIVVRRPLRRSPCVTRFGRQKPLASGAEAVNVCFQACTACHAGSVFRGVAYAMTRSETRGDSIGSPLLRNRRRLTPRVTRFQQNLDFCFTFRNPERKGLLDREFFLYSRFVHSDSRYLAKRLMVKPRESVSSPSGEPVSLEEKHRMFCKIDSKLV